MVDRHILAGDMIVVCPQRTADDGDVVVARINGETKVKRHDKGRLVSDQGSVTIDDSVQIVGRVVGLIRSRC